MKELTKAQATKVAKMRREGSTWAEVSAEMGHVRSSTGWRLALEPHGFDKLGRKDGKGESAAKAWGSADGNLRGRDAKPKRKRATAKKQPANRKPTAKQVAASADKFTTRAGDLQLS